MNTKIAVLHKKELLKLIEIEGYNRDLIYPKLLERIESCEQIIEDSEITIPTNYRAWPTRNNITKGFLDLKNLAGILCLYLLDYKDEGTPIYLHRYNYTVEGLQKIFAHLDKEQLKQIDLSTNYKEEYNKFLKKLTESEHPFGLIQLDENWNITGKECESVENIENYIIELDNKIEKKSKNSSEQKVLTDETPDERKDSLIPEKPNFFRTYKKSIITVLIVFFIGLMSILVYNNHTKEKLPFDEIKIGNQTWSGIINIPLSESYCYENIDHNCESFGRLYSYNSAKRIANKFDGWEIPTKEDYDILINHLGGEESATELLMKGGSSGFNASLTGYRTHEIEYVNEKGFGKPKIKNVSFKSLGKEGSFWTSSRGDTSDEFGRDRPYALRLNRTFSLSNMCDCWSYSDALSLRLIKTDRGYKETKIKEGIDSLSVINTSENVYIDEAPYIYNNCSFDKSDPSDYKILILPFRTIIKDNNVEKDIGAIIEERLEKINKRDSLNLNIFYCKDFKYDKNVGHGDEADYYKSVMKMEGADHIIYGSSKDINSSNNMDLTKIRLGYCTNLKESIAGALGCNNQYDYKLTSLSKISQGELLGDVENLIYWNTAIGTFQKEYYINTLKYLNIILSSKHTNNLSNVLQLRTTTNVLIGNLQDAIMDIDNILTKKNTDKEKANLLNQKGLIKILQTDSDAIKFLNQSIQLDNTAGTFLNIADYYWRIKRDSNKAIEYYKKGIELAESNDEKAYFYNALSQIQFNINDYNNALISCETAINLSPKGYCQWLNKGTNLFMLKMPRQALDAINKSIDINSNYYLSYIWKGSILYELGLRDLAIENLNHSLELYPLNNYSINTLLDIYLLEKKYEICINLLNELIKKQPKNVTLLLKRSSIYKLMGCSEEASDDIAKVEKLSPTLIINDITNEVIPVYDSIPK